MQTDSRVRFKAPASLIADEEAKEPRVIVREALLLALASDTPSIIIQMHSDWYEGFVRDDEIKDIRIRTYDYDVITNQVTHLTIKARSVVLAYGLHLRRLVLDQYVPLATRKLHNETPLRALFGQVDKGAQNRDEGKSNVAISSNNASTHPPKSRHAHLETPPGESSRRLKRQPVDSKHQPDETKLPKEEDPSSRIETITPTQGPVEPVEPSVHTADSKQPKKQSNSEGETGLNDDLAEMRSFATNLF